MIGIYKVTNLINGKVYIGQSDNIEFRWKTHRNHSQKKYGNDYDCLFYRAIRKYGLNNFKFEVIEECQKNQLNEKEMYWIKFYNSFIGFVNCNGYNMTRGGQTSSFSILKYEQVKEIQKLLLTTRTSQQKIGEQFGVTQTTISQINQGLIWREEDLNYPLREKAWKEEDKKHYYCVDCGKEITYNATRCTNCSHKMTFVVEHPSREELKRLIRTTPFTVLGKQFGVSDNAIRKWCDVYNLPRKSLEIKSFSDEDWEKI